MKKLSSITLLVCLSLSLSGAGSKKHAVSSLTMVEVSARYCIDGTWSDWETKTCKVVVDIYDDVPLIVIHNKLDQSFVLNELKTTSKGLNTTRSRFLISKIYVGKDNAGELLTVIVIKYNDGNFKLSFLYDNIMYSYSEAGFHNEIAPKILLTENSVPDQNKIK
jgi:hypothetical protein